MTIVDTDNLLATVLNPYNKLFTKATPNVTFVEGIVVAIWPHEQGGVVVLADGTELPYNTLVLVPGCLGRAIELPVEERGSRIIRERELRKVQ